MNSKRQTSAPANRGSKRSGAMLMIVTLLLPVLLGITGLVLDGGLMMAVHRQSRNAADAAALAAAESLLRGESLAKAKTTAATFVQQHNGLKSATVTVNNPPASGPYAGQSAYVEVLVKQPISTALIHVLGIARDRTVTARAVAGYEKAPSAADVLALDPNARPGLSISGNGNLRINGAVAINSEGGGVDQYGKPVANGNSGYAATVSNNGKLFARNIQVVGGVNSPGNFQQYDPNISTNPLTANSLPQADPFRYLPPPTTANGADPTEWPAVKVSGNTTTILYPGVYPSISITSGNVVLEPGIYIIKGGELKITEQNVRAEGVMFYVTGSDYNVNTGHPDTGDLSPVPAPPLGGTTFGSVTINAGLKFTGLDNPGHLFHGMLFYQRRMNTQAFNIQGNSASGNVAGTIYAKNAPMKIAGQGIYNAQFVVSTLDVSGNGDVTINKSAHLVAQSDRVFLVE